MTKECPKPNGQNGQTTFDRGLTLLAREAKSFLSGDRTLTTENVSSPGTILLATDSIAKWAEGIHYRDKRFLGKEYVGRVAFADGSVRRLGQMELGKLVRVSYPPARKKS